jgi:acetyl esterase/lipase
MVLVNIAAVVEHLQSPAMKSLNKRYTLLLWASTVLLLACKKEMSEPDGTNASKAATLMNQAYGTGERQKADFYLPAGRSTTATDVLILLHGGSWVAGDKSDIDNIIPEIQSANPDVAIVNMNYTLADNGSATRFPAQLNDIETLLSFLAGKEDSWKVGSNRSLVGISSGGHLALMYAYTRNSNGAIDLVASVVGPADLTDPYYNSQPIFQQVLTTFLGKTYTEDSLLYRGASPAWRVSNTAPPTFLSYGALDVLVPITQPQLLARQLQNAAVPVEFITYPDEGHEYSPLAAANTIIRLAVFYKEHMP